MAYVKRDTFKGHPTIQFWKSKEDAEKNADGDKSIKPIVSFGMRKAVAILGEVRDLYKFVVDGEGEVPLEVIELFENAGKKGKKTK